MGLLYKGMKIIEIESGDVLVVGYAEHVTGMAGNRFVSLLQDLMPEVTVVGISCRIADEITVLKRKQGE